MPNDRENLHTDLRIAETPMDAVNAYDEELPREPAVLLCGTGPFETEMLRRALQRGSFRIVFAHDVDAAVVAVLADGLEAVVLGDAMPPAPRTALVRWIRATPGICALPIVFLSDDPEPASAVHAYDTGVDLVVVKPVDVDLLGRKLAAVIQRGGRVQRAGGA